MPALPRLDLPQPATPMTTRNNGDPFDRHIGSAIQSNPKSTKPYDAGSVPRTAEIDTKSASTLLRAAGQRYPNRHSQEPHEGKPRTNPTPNAAQRRITLSDVLSCGGRSPHHRIARSCAASAAWRPNWLDRVRVAVQQLGYVPTPPPAPRSQRSVQVPVLVPLLSNALFVDVLDAVHRVLFPPGYQA